MPTSSISIHEGECWDLFVVAVAILNDTLIELEKEKPN